MLRDGRKHRSPNAGWPEAAMAGALGLALAGPRHYHEGTVEDPLLGDGTPRAPAAPTSTGRCSCIAGLPDLAGLCWGLGWRRIYAARVRRGGRAAASSASRSRPASR